MIENKVIKKLFISQPIKGKDDNEIIAEREKIINEVKEKFKDEEIEVINSFFQGTIKANNIEVKPLLLLGQSLILLSTADYVYFADDWDKYRGCKIEHECAKQYGYNIVKD